jgi:hypothetical protein
VRGLAHDNRIHRLTLLPVSIGDMRVAIADHLGWAIAVTASADHE